MTQMKNTQKLKKSPKRLQGFGVFFLQNHTQTKMEMFAFCVTTFEPIMI